MAISHDVLIQYTGSGRAIRQSKAFTGDADASYSVAIADSVTDQLVVNSIDVSQVKSMIMMSDQDLTVETNSSSAPTDTITLKANSPYVFDTNRANYDAFLLTADVTAIYLTNASGSAATFDLVYAFDSTP